MDSEELRQTLEALRGLSEDEDQQQSLNYLMVNIAGDASGNLNIAHRIIQRMEMPNSVRERLEGLLDALKPQVHPSGKRLFLSYAWSDDAPFVERLYHDLTQRGYMVWWDRMDLPSRGIPILQELRDTIIDEVDRVLPVIGPMAMKSTNVQYEWNTARAGCKIITPLLRLSDPADLPDDFLRVLYFDFRDNTHYAAKLSELLASLETSIKPPGTLVGVPALPPHFLSRPKDMSALESLLVQAPVTVLQGMGGSGKSALAAAFARGCEARRAFADGIIC